MPNNFNPYIYSIFPHLKQTMLNRMFNTSNEDKTELTIRTIHGSINLSVDGSTGAVLPTFNEFDMMMTIVAYARELGIQQIFNIVNAAPVEERLTILAHLQFPLIVIFESKKDLLNKLKGYTYSKTHLKLLDKTLNCFNSYRITFNNSLLLNSSKNYSVCTSTEGEDINYSKNLSKIETSYLPCDYFIKMYRANATFKIVSDIEIDTKPYYVALDTVFSSLLTECCVDSEFDDVKGFNIDNPVLMTTSNVIHEDPYADF